MAGRFSTGRSPPCGVGGVERDRHRARLPRRDIEFSRARLFRQPSLVADQHGDVARRRGEWLRAGPVIVSYADIFYRGDVVRGLAEEPGALVISFDRRWRNLWSRRFADPLSDAETFRINSAGELLEIGGRTQTIEDIEGQYMGLLKFTPVAWQAAEEILATLDSPSRDRLDMTGLLRRLLAAKSIAISTFGIDGEWGEIDNPGDVELYQSMIRDGELTLEAPLRADERERGAHEKPRIAINDK